LHQSGCHNAYAKEVANVGKMHVKIPTNRLDIVKNTKTSNAPNETKRTVNGLKN
jgi:hypothetical protein